MENNVCLYQKNTGAHVDKYMNNECSSLTIGAKRKESRKNTSYCGYLPNPANENYLCFWGREQPPWFWQKEPEQLQQTHATVLSLRSTLPPIWDLIPSPSPLPSMLTYPPPIKCHVQMFKPSLQCCWQARACGVPQRAGEVLLFSTYRKEAHACKTHIFKGPFREHWQGAPRMLWQLGKRGLDGWF